LIIDDNVLIDGKTGQVRHGGNFQAMDVTNATEKTRIASYRETSLPAMY
jgi:histidine ammonia-lyase